jgi:uncharacterized protein YjbI with pentapeptide repeats
VAAEPEPLSTAPVHENRANAVPRWLVVSAALVLAAVVVGVIVYGYLAKPGWVGVSDKKFWDYLELLIVPAALALGVYWLNRAQRESEREAEEARRERELEVEDQRAQDAALQAYLDQMSQLLTDKERPLRRAQPGDHLSVVARAWTLTVLTRLDGARKASVVRFLYESGLIRKDRLVLDLTGANLTEADLFYGVNLVGAYLRRADLREAFLPKADLRGADLGGANLVWASLPGTNLRGADLSGAILSSANLSEADLRRTHLHSADLSEANLEGAVGVIEELLDIQAASLENATMPNGQKYDDWLKSKGSGEDEENTGAS